jgi:hypothetical protein
MGVYELGKIGRLNQIHSIQPKNWIGSGNWMDMDFKNEKSIKRIKNQIPDKTELNPKH